MRLSLLRAAALAFLLLPATPGRSADPPPKDPLAEHERVMRSGLDSWNDIATSLSLIRDARDAERSASILRDSLITASKGRKPMEQLRSPTREEERALCRRVLVQARAVRARVKSESDRVARIPGLAPEITSLLTKMALVNGSLAKIIAKGESSPGPVPTLPPGAPVWTSDPRRTAELGEEKTLLERRYMLRGPKGYTFAGETEPPARTATVTYTSGRNSLALYLVRGMPEPLSLEEFTKSTQGFTAKSIEPKQPTMGAIEMGAIDGKPFCRYRYTLARPADGVTDGFGYITLHDDARNRYFVVAEARGARDQVAVLEAALLTIRLAKGNDQ